jgi:hypothetical protein
MLQPCLLPNCCKVCPQLMLVGYCQRRVVLLSRVLPMPKAFVCLVRRVLSWLVMVMAQF